MVIYSCEKCGKTFKQKGHYTNHINKKNPCDNIKDKIENIVENKVDELVKEKIQELVEKGEIEIKNKNKNLIQTSKNLNTSIDSNNMSKIGKNREITDQFYTKESVSRKCIDLFMKHVTINENDIIIEPSAGSGSFSDYFKENEYNIHAFDIDPKKDYIQKCDYLEFDIDVFKGKPAHCIGNPPFGRQSSLAKKFIKKNTKFCNTISFILPKSFRKQSFQKVFPLNFHLVEEIDLDKNSFEIDGKTHNVPCVFQIWIKKEEKRFIEPKIVEKGFHFVKKPILKNIETDENGYPIKRENIFIEEPDFGILRAGGGNTCGRISLEYKDGISCYPEAWLFIKLDDQYDKQKFYDEYKKIDWTDDSNVGARSIDKQRFIKGINITIENL